MNFHAIKFSKEEKADFINTLRGRVNQYFKTHNISKYANSKMIFKTIFNLSLYFIPYILILSGLFTSNWVIFILWILMGFGMAGIGMCVMHDANHSAYSKNSFINKLVGNLIILIGGSAINWKIQHNRLHHGYTNIDGIDEDIFTGNIMRFSPHQKRFKIHRLQHYYAWFFYGLMTLYWSTGKDFKQLLRYKKQGLIDERKKSFAQLLIELITSKLFYQFYVLLIPIIILPTPWWIILLFYLSMHFVAGLSLGIIFQTAHVMPDSEYPLPDKAGNMGNTWGIHQMLTTSNYAPTSRFFSWFIGGLNYQIEHHLFPSVCHIHYRNISPIVQQTAREYGVPYHIQSNFLLALWNHAKLLKLLGKK